MSQRKIDYPDLSKPLVQNQDVYPDLSQPMPPMPQITKRYQYTPSFAEKLAPNVLAGLAQLGHQLINAPHNIANIFSPELASKIPAQQNYDFSRMLNIPGTTADKVVQALTQNIPAIAMPALPLGAAGNAIRAIPGVGNFAANAIGRIIPQASFGALTNENPLQGAQNAAMMQGVAEALPLPFKLAGKGLDYINPSKYAQNILSGLGKGLDIGQNAREFAKKIQGSYNTLEDEGRRRYDAIFNRPDLVSNSDVGLAIKNGKFNQLSDKVTNKFTPDIEDLTEELSKNPSLKNAHELQSELGYEIRRLEKMDRRNALSTADKVVLQSYRKARNSLLDDIDSGLDKVSPDLKNQYADATNYWSENVVPYLQNPKLSEIVKSKPEKLSAKKVFNIGNEFKNPDEDINKIVNDVGPEAHRHILYDRLGKLSGKVTPENLANEMTRLRNEGYASYISPELEKLMGGLSNRTKARLTAQALPGALSGFAFGSHFGPGAEFLGATIGSPLSVGLMKSINALLPKQSLPGAVKNALLESYQPLVRAGQIGYNEQNKNQ